MSQHLPFDMADYLGSNKHRQFSAPICREERQYAVLLYMAFLAVKAHQATPLARKIVRQSLGVKAHSRLVVKDVFFEVTLMRDFHELSKRTGDAHTFNHCLLSFCNRHKKKTVTKNNMEHASADEIMKCFEKAGLSDQNIGNVNFSRTHAGNTSSFRKIYPVVNLAANMMNAKPDLGVLYSDDGKDCFVMLECKYLSDLGNYGEYMQTDVENLICKFICSIIKNKTVSSKSTRVIRFHNRNDTVKYNSDKTLLEIDDLLEGYKNSFFEIKL